MTLRIAADIGGTFTDIALLTGKGELATRKVPSTPEDFARGVVDGIAQLLKAEQLAPRDIGDVLHACTIATNTILEGRGAPTALITTEGFRDVLEMRRIRVPRLYDPLYLKPPVLVPRRLRLEVTERVGPRGEVIVPLDAASVDRVIERLKRENVTAIAVCFLHSYANPDHERRVGDRLRKAFPDAFISLSVDILPEIREYERTSTTVINALVGPPMRDYLQSLLDTLAKRGLPKRVQMMQSAGGIVDVRTVIRKPAQVVECGPAAGVIGARHAALLAGYKDIISFDMGGTTAKASLVENGTLSRTDEYEVGGGISLSSRLVKGGGYALKLPVIDISEVGAGGGSIVWLDRAGSLKVGPHSAGAIPGPACYDMGGTEPTVTDANVVLGYLNPSALAGGSLPIKHQLSHETIDRVVANPLGTDIMKAAFGIHQVVTTVMTRAVKTVSTYRGRDPRHFTLFAFGGNGGIHAGSLARSLGIRHVVLPSGAGVFSALGLLFADVETNTSAAFLKHVHQAVPAEIEAIYVKLAAEVAGELGRPPGEMRITRLADLRYAGQAFELSVPLAPDDLAAAAARFEAEHEKTYGYRLSGKPIEIVTLRVTGSIDTGGPKQIAPPAPRPTRTRAGTQRNAYFGDAFGTLVTPVIPRHDLDSKPRRGPFIVEEYEGTTLVQPDMTAKLDEAGNIIIELDGAAA
jgi:N-methylhydantoinase A